MTSRQRTVLGRYHVTEPASWFLQDDSWRTPPEPTASSGAAAPAQPPYYLTMQMPGETSPTFSLYTTYIPQQTGTNARNNLTGYLAVNSDAGSTGGIKSPRYGVLQLLALPKSSTVPGPGTVQGQFNSNTTVANALNLLDRGGSSVKRGNLLTLPVGGGLLYVQPVYVQSSASTQYPLLRKVLVAFGEKVAFEDTLDEALNTLFNGDSGADTGDSSISDQPPSTGSGSTPTTGTPTAALTQALTDAKKALADRQAAYAKNDLVGAAQADKRLQTALQDADNATG